MKQAMLFRKLEDGKVQCRTCAHVCTIGPGKRGLCGVRENREGVLYSLVYEKAIAVNVDPIEKKPLFHFYPGTRAFSMATVGCNFRCDNCQNSDISQMPRESGRITGEQITPEDLVKEAVRHHCRTIAYTYTEPAVFFDYAYETATLAHQSGLKNIFVTNGYLSEEALGVITPCLDGANVDLKAFRDESYTSVCGARLKPVLDSILRMKEAGIWVEVTTLLIPGFNDSDDEVRDIARFIRDCDPGIPWHISRFHPTYRMTDRPATPVETIQRACEIGVAEGLKTVYAGNIPGDEKESTFCYACGVKLITRRGFEVVENRLENGKCTDCGAEIDGIW